MQGIANDILANPNKYSVDMLKRGMESGSIPPYVAIPAIQEILRLRKQMQGAPDPQAAQQPPIAQQVMQEADAIAALPTNLPAQYAGGGIVAFADGGEVERFQAGGSPQLELPGMNTRATGPLAETVQERIARLRALGLLPESGNAARGPYTPKTPQDLAARSRALTQAPTASAAPAAGSATAGATGASPSLVSKGIRALGRFAANPFTVGAGLFFSDMREAGAGSDIVPGRPARAIPTPMEITTLLREGKISEQDADNMLQERTRRDRERERTTPPSTTDTGATTGTGATIGTGATPRARPAAPAAPQAGIAALPVLGELSGPSNLRRAETAVADMRGLADMEEQFAAQGVRDLRSQLTGKPFEEYRQRLEGEARQAGVERADAKNLAFVKAGLAMMAGTSQHALVNIGQGAMAGVADWQAAVKDLKKADRERSKEMALIDQAARAEQRGDVKDQMSALERARDRGIAFESSMTNMLINAGFADNQRAAERVLAQFNADAGIFRTREQTAAQERISAQDNATRLEAARIQAEAARDRAAARPAIPPSVANQINREVGEKVPQIRQDVLKSLGLTEKGLSDASRAIVDRTVQEIIQQEIDQRVQSNLQISAGISGLAPTPTAGRPTMEVVRQRPVPQ
jgi:hypothetical protein